MKIEVRSATSADSNNYVRWLADNPAADPRTVTYPTANTAVIEQDGAPVAMNTVHLVLMQEALARKPGLTDREGARAIKALHEALKNLAAISGVREIWFECTDPRIEKIALKRGFTRVNHPVLKYKLEQ